MGDLLRVYFIDRFGDGLELVHRFASLVLGFTRSAASTASSGFSSLVVIVHVSTQVVPAEEWLSIIENFPISPPPAYDMLAISLNATRLVVVPVAVMNTAGAPILRFALPGGTVPQSRVKPWAGPIFARSLVSVRASETLEGDFVLDSNSDQELIDVDLVDASAAVLSAIWRPEDHPDDLIRGFKAFGADDLDGPAGIPVWPCMQDLLDHSCNLVGRPTVAFEPEQ